MTVIYYHFSSNIKQKIESYFFLAKNDGAYIFSVIFLSKRWRHLLAEILFIYFFCRKVTIKFIS